ncbi:MAG: RNA polymerase sigma factor [Bacteroidota bacterium]|jgi:RNA polymerase sigma factor (sigma-70 family)
MLEKKSWTDAEFVEGIKNSDDRALSMVYKTFFKIVLKHVLNNNGSEDDAKDIYQESVLILYKAAKKEDFRLNCQLQTFIVSIAKRLWLKHLRASGRLVKLERNSGNIPDEDIASAIEAYEQRQEEIESMTIGLNQLGEPCKTLITDFYYKKLDMEEIAEKFGYTNSDNAKNQKYKCLQRLKKIVLKD